MADEARRRSRGRGGARVELVREDLVAGGAAALSPYHDLRGATSEVLGFLRSRVPMQLWMVTRTDGEHWTVVDTIGDGPLRTGEVLRWSDSLCSAMVERGAPRVAPDVDAIPEHAATRLRRALRIRAYVGVPLGDDHGTVFGTLCAIDSKPHPESLRDELPLVEMCGRLLSTLLSVDMQAAEQAHRAERAEVEALTDPLTGLANRRAWDRLVAAEEARCRRHGNAAAVLAVDIDGLKQVNDRDGHGAGDLLLAGAARALTQSTREQDVVARLGGDEFGVLCVESDAAAAAHVVARLRTALAARGIEASIGMAARTATGGIAGAAQAADRAMYADKRERRATV